MTPWFGRLAVALGALAFVLVAVGTGGYSSMAADRAVSIDVVDDDEAFLGVERAVVTDTENSTVVSLAVTNRLSTDVTVDIDHRTGGGSAVGVRPETFELSVGETRDVEVSIDCTATAAGEIELEIYAVGDRVELGLMRAVDARCG